MPRRARSAAGGVIYHVLNRANARGPLFAKDGDYAAFVRTLLQAHERTPMRVLAWCLMPTHWHFVLWPREDGDLSRFVGWLTHAHTQRRHAHYHTAGTGHVYQGRFKSFPIQDDVHLRLAARYVERNAVRAGLADKTRQWPWGSAAARCGGDAALKTLLLPDEQWPIERGEDWDEWVDRPQTAAELDALRRCVKRGSPFGHDPWVWQTAVRLGLESTLRPRGRPRKRAPTAEAVGVEAEVLA
jgi:putative transposase